MLRAEALTLSGWLRRSRLKLEDAVPSPRHDSERLAAHVLGLSWSDIWSRLREPLDAAKVDRLEAVLARRADGDPLGYITGSVVFYGIDVECGPGVLVPRPETEVLVDTALELIAGIGSPVVVDIGTGSGAVALAIAGKRNDARIWASDVSSAALRYAERNVASTGAEVSLVEGDLFAGLPSDLHGRVDLVVSNPPYIADDAELPADVRAEPAEAVLAGPRGDEVLLRLAAEATEWISSTGAIALEIGTPEQSVTVSGALVGYTERGTSEDQNGCPRVVWARR